MRFWEGETSKFTSPIPDRWSCLNYEKYSSTRYEIAKFSQLLSVFFFFFCSNERAQGRYVFVYERVNNGCNSTLCWISIFANFLVSKVGERLFLDSKRSYSKIIKLFQWNLNGCSRFFDKDGGWGESVGLSNLLYFSIIILPNIYVRYKISPVLIESDC